MCPDVAITWWEGGEEVSLERVLMKGNEALAGSRHSGGLPSSFGYPITPQTELAAYMSKQMPQIGGTYLQAESEWPPSTWCWAAPPAGARVMTSSLLARHRPENRGHLLYCGLRRAGADHQCTGVAAQALAASSPRRRTTGKPPRRPPRRFPRFVLCPSHGAGDGGSRGDAFDLGDQYRMPAMILDDGMLGQMMEPVESDKSNRRKARKALGCHRPQQQPGPQRGQLACT